MAGPLLASFSVAFFLFSSFAGHANGQKSPSDELKILLELKFSLGISHLAPGFESWREDNPPCEFSFVSCEDRSSVSGIHLGNQKLSGTIPFKSICRLQSLAQLDLSSTGVYGGFGTAIGSCVNLEFLDLSGNSLSGVVPDLSSLKKLQALNLSGNAFTGDFPWRSLLSMPSLSSLGLGDNPFNPTLSFPEELSTMTKLKSLYLSNCGIQGTIPPWIGNLTALESLELADNLLLGEIPREISNLEKLWQLELYNNSLTGTLPAGFGKLSNLVYLDASMNNLQGDLSEIRYLTKLVSLQLFQNNFSGQVPFELGNFRNLVNLSLYSNQLSGALPSDLGKWADFDFIDVSTNLLSGPIPPQMCKNGAMTRLLMLENRFAGEIPASYSFCESLIRFRVSKNLLSGEIPPGIWALPRVNIIDLAMNNFSGAIGEGIGRAKALSQLSINGNQFSGELPAAISSAASLVSIEASDNLLSGEIPAAIGDLKKLQRLDLHSNRLKGEIPSSLGSCSSLSQVSLSDNSLSGAIPAALSLLPNLNSLNLSDNGISGEIPAALAALKLNVLDLSRNNLTGELPQSLAVDAYSESFSGNANLCSSTASFLRRCGPSSSSREAKLSTVIPIIASAAIAAVLIAWYLFKTKKKEGVSALSGNSWDMKSFQAVTFDEKKIVSGIRAENLIGRGGSGEVYRVELGEGQRVAVKVIRKPMAKAFEAEVAALSSIRHANVVKLFCSITGEEGSLLLVHEYLCNGSLWDHLHGEVEGKGRGGLEWFTRYEVAVGAARGLEYLHHGLSRPIIHHDVKSSNILLDESFQPRIADFGAAKVVLSGAGDDGSTGHVAGTLGYIAPEFAYTARLSTKSDVYSFGVVLLELATGRKPIEADFGEHKDIVGWVYAKMGEDGDGPTELLDPSIPQSSREEALKVLRTGVLCTMRLPALRPSMRSVVQMLKDASRAFPQKKSPEKAVTVSVV
ncbi:leucine-rich receptor-like protein kinase family protein [Wolffia australiana]